MSDDVKQRPVVSKKFDRVDVAIWCNEWEDGSRTLLDREQIAMLGELKVGQAIVKLQDRHVRPFLVEVPRIPVRKGTVTDEMIREKMQGYFADSSEDRPPAVETPVCTAVPPTDEKTDHHSDVAGRANWTGPGRVQTRPP